MYKNKNLMQVTMKSFEEHIKKHFVGNELILNGKDNTLIKELIICVSHVSYAEALITILKYLKDNPNRNPQIVALELMLVVAEIDKLHKKAHDEFISENLFPPHMCN